MLWVTKVTDGPMSKDIRITDELAEKYILMLKDISDKIYSLVGFLYYEQDLVLGYDTDCKGLFPDGMLSFGRSLIADPSSARCVTGEIKAASELTSSAIASGGQRDSHPRERTGINRQSSSVDIPPSDTPAISEPKIQNIHPQSNEPESPFPGSSDGEATVAPSREQGRDVDSRGYFEGGPETR